jgi:hypothetical protein
MKLELSRQILEKKSPNITIHEYPSSGSRVVTCGQTYITELIIACFSQFCERIKGVKKKPSSLLLVETKRGKTCHDGWRLCRVSNWHPPAQTTRSVNKFTVSWSNKRRFMSQSEFYYSVVLGSSIWTQQQTIRSLCKFQFSVSRHGSSEAECFTVKLIWNL